MEFEIESSKFFTGDSYIKKFIYVVTFCLFSTQFYLIVHMINRLMFGLAFWKSIDSNLNKYSNTKNKYLKNCSITQILKHNRVEPNFQVLYTWF